MATISSKPDSGTVAIRRVMASDQDAVADLWRRCFPDDPPRNEPVALFRRKLAQDDGLFWLAEGASGSAGSRGPVIGVVMAGYDGVRGWIYHLAADPRHRRQGIGAALVRTAIAELKAQGCPKVNLQVRQSNREVLEFYRALGFQEEPALSLGLPLDH